MYQITWDQPQTNNSGYLALMVKMPMGVPDRLYAVQLPGSTSSGLTVRGPTALWAELDRWLNRDALAFERDGELFVASPDGTSPRKIGVQGVGAVSASSNGVLAFDRFSPMRNQSQDLTIYLLDKIDGPPRRLTDDNRSIQPVISPDGRSLVYQKFEWNASGNDHGTGRGLWLYDLYSGEQHQLVGTIEDTSGYFDSHQWQSDNNVVWSSDNQVVFFERYYKARGNAVWPRGYIVHIPTGQVEPYKKEIASDEYVFPLFFGRGKVAALYRANKRQSLVEQDLTKT